MLDELDHSATAAAGIPHLVQRAPLVDPNLWVAVVLVAAAAAEGASAERRRHHHGEHGQEQQQTAGGNQYDWQDGQERAVPRESALTLAQARERLEYGRGSAGVGRILCLCGVAAWLHLIRPQGLGGGRGVLRWLIGAGRRQARLN